MTDNDRDLLKWIAEELLGWKHDPGWHNSDLYWWRQEDELRPGRREPLTYFQSWHGIGLVVEEMERRGWYFGAFDRSILKNNKGDRRLEWSANFYREGEFEGQNWTPGNQPWFAVYEAARKAVTND